MRLRQWTMLYISLKLLHISFFSAWFAGLFALPWVFGEHAAQRERAAQLRLRTIERSLYFGITTPAGVLAVVFGSLLMLFGFEGAWLQLKLTLIVLAVAFHLYCGTVMLSFLQRRNRRGRLYFRFLSQVPLALLIGIVALATAKPI